MSDRLVTVDDPTQIGTGIVKSLHKLQVPVWIDGQNVVFEDGTVRKSPGYTSYFTVTGTLPVLGIEAIDVNGTPNLVWGDINNLYRWSGSALTTDGTGYTGTINDDMVQDNAVQETDGAYNPSFQTTINTFPGDWSFENFGIWSLATNGVQQIQINKMAGGGYHSIPTTVQGDGTGGAPATAQILIRFAEQMLAFNLSGTNPDGTVYDSSFFAFSDIDGPETWTSTQTQGEAGYLPIRDLNSPIKAAVRLNAYIGVYSADSMALVISLGAPLYFGAQKIFDGIGAVSKHSVVPVGLYNYGISSKGVWETDGTQYQYISPPFLRHWIEQNVNFAFANQVAGYLDEDRSLVKWGLPTYAGNGQNDVTIAFNVDTKSWTFFNYGITAGCAKGIFNYPAFGTSTGKVYFGNSGVDADGAPIDAWVQSKPFLCLAPNMSPFAPKNPPQWKIIDMLIMAMKDLQGTVNLYVGWQDNLADPITWSDPYPLDANSQPIFVVQSLAATIPQQIQGKYFSIKIRSTGLGCDWTFCGFEMFGSFGGTEF